MGEAGVESKVIRDRQKMWAKRGMQSEIAQRMKLTGSEWGESGTAAAVTSQTAWKGFPHHYLSFSQQEASADKENYLLDIEHEGKMCNTKIFYRSVIIWHGISCCWELYLDGSGYYVLCVNRCSILEEQKAVLSSDATTPGKSRVRLEMSWVSCHGRSSLSTCAHSPYGGLRLSFITLY